MKTKISALIDGELETREMRETFASLRHDGELRRACSDYLLIGDALRREPHLAIDIIGAVFDHLADEPVVLAPRRFFGTGRERSQWQRPALALAATVAGVAIVAWLGLPAQFTQQGPQLVATAQKMTQTLPVTVAAIDDADMQEYLIAHQVHSGSFYLNGESQHIRTVSLNGVEAHQ